MASGVPGIVVLALGAGALGAPDALRLLIPLAGRSPAADIGVCVFVFAILTAQLLGFVLVSRFVRKPQPAGGAGGAGRRGAPATDYLARITLVLSLAAASLVAACLVFVSGGPGLHAPRPSPGLTNSMAVAVVVGAALLVGLYRRAYNAAAVGGGVAAPAPAPAPAPAATPRTRRALAR